MACTFNVEIGKKQIDKQSGRIKESFLSVTHDGKLSCPKVQSPSSSNVENREKAKCETGLEKYYTVERIIWSKQPMRNTLSGAVWTTSTSTLVIENGNSANLLCWHMNRDILVIAICWCVCIYIPYYVCLCSKYIMFDHFLWTHQPLQVQGWMSQHSTHNT